MRNKKTFSYDDIDQLISEDWSTGYSADYEYDANGNRTKRTVGSTVEDYFYDDADKLEEIKIGSTVTKSYGYDDWGRRTSMTDSGGTTDYAYDSQSRLTSITRTGLTTNSFGYNGFDTRVSKTDSTGTTSYKRAGAGVTASLLKSTISGTTTDYTPGISSRVSSTSTFMHSGLKNSDEQSGSGGTIAASLQYDAFGKQVSSSGTWVGAFKYGGPYGYQTDPDHGLKLLGHRYYEADTGRFLTRDPIKDGRNWYGYCGNGPLVMADPTGLAPSWLENAFKSIKNFASEVGHIIKGGIKVIVIVPAVIEFYNAIDQAKHEKDYFIEYRKRVTDAVDNGQLSEERGYELIKINRPKMQGPLNIIKRWWELLIDIS
ncbi:MAG: hypothetical protein K1X67_18130 [Fimbriimonadaceae bacterium]|nr:hypothetical protein [Fimbriimonadaceae bacterium]